MADFNRCFERYPQESMPARRKIIDRLISVIKAEIKAKNNPQKNNQKAEAHSKNPHEVDVIYIKRRRPKIGYALNKLGIYTAADLLFISAQTH